ncbi:hypothetical protein [Pedobacter sp. SG918]|uniref:hypothetical protein n=1 Tax=Pedobacter sp. SG918 TaxID=2587136 RepID=UPI00146D565B|nr:hypothetical protein [Pedobacter sp. SG918]NMN37183.1 hypothetical protein [Pedobacter sp. SG918]
MKKIIITLFFLCPFLLKAQYGKEVVANGWQQLYVYLGSFPPDDASNLKKATQLIANTVTETLPSGLVEIAPLNIRPIQTSDYEGNIAINMASTDANYKLSVNGKIRAKEVRVEAANWPDYVFEEGYDLGTLKGLESYIKTNKHLPEMPSAKEIEANGVSVSEMLKLQQKKWRSSLCI